MGKKAPKAPKPPDPYATAAAQTQSNRETAIANANLNRINQYTPEGSLEFRQIGTNADGTPQFASYQAYSPEQQKLYENELATSNALSALGLQNIGRVADAQSQPFNYNGMSPLQTGYDLGGLQYGYDAGGGIQRGYDLGGDIASGYGYGGDIASGYNAGGPIATGFNAGGNIQKGLNFGTAPKLPGINDFGAEAQRTQDAVYKQATSRLDPQWQQQERQLATQLAGKGVSENSEAYRRAMDQMSRQRTDAYNQANYSAIGAGSQEQSRLFGLALQGRQQSVGETQAAGQFANAAQAQQYGQNQGMAAFQNAAQQQYNSQNREAAQFQNQSQAQREEQYRERANFQNAAQQQRNQQNALLAAFGNQAQAQANQQNAAQAAFWNTSQGQAAQQNQALATFQNQARQQQIQEATYLRNLPLNEISALMGAAGGVSAPQFANYANVNQAGTDYAGIVQNNFANQMQLYQQKLAQQNALTGSIFGTLGSIGGAALMASDRRVKEGIKAVGELANGIKTYVFRYIGDRATQFGVMADEVLNVRPEAVVHTPSGLLMVDYRKVW